MHVSRLLIVHCCLALTGCDRKAPPAPPVVEPPVDNGTINGTERLGWDQPAADAVEIATIGYVVYVDGTRTVLDAVACAPSPRITFPVSFACSARLPTLTPGAHALELASFVNARGVRESVRSAPLRVTVVPVATPASQIVRPATSFTAGSPSRRENRGSPPNTDAAVLRS
jgi:hypothetical protein